MKNRSPKYLLLLTVLLITVLALASCNQNPQPNATQEDPSSGSGGSSDSEEEKKSEGDLTVLFEDLPARICIGETYDITLLMTWNDGTLVSGDMSWEIIYSKGLQGSTSDYQERKTITMTLHNSPKKENLKAQVKIENGETEDGLVLLTQLFGETEQEVEFIYCDYKINLEYSGSFVNEVFQIKETANMETTIRIDPETGEVDGEGVLNLKTTQEINQEGVSCDVSWEGEISALITGRVDNGKITLEFEFENTVIEDRQLSCDAAGVSISVPAKGGPVNLSPFGLDKITISSAGESKVLPVGSPISPSGGTGSGKVTIVLEPKKE